MSARIDRPSSRPPVTQPRDRRVVERQPTAPTKPNQIQDALQRDQLDRSRQTGVSGPYTPGSGPLDQSPQYQTAYARAGASDRQLLDALRSAPNGDNAFATYQNLRSGPQNPDRLTDSMVRDMVMGVATPRGGDHNSPEGLLSQAHVDNAKTALFSMPQEQFQKFKSTLDSTGNAGEAAQPGSDPATERQLLIKALGARSGALGSGNAAFADQAMNEVVGFGRDIRGINAAQLKTSTTVLETDKSFGYGQGGAMTCSAATLMTMKAENDPIYAMRVRGNALAGNGANAASEDALLRTQGGTAETGLNAEGTSGLYNGQGPDPNVRYSSRMLEQGALGGQINSIADSVAKGYDVPIAVRLGTGGGHAMNIAAVTGKPGDRTFLVHDTGTGGQTRAVPEKDLLDGSFLSKHFGYSPEQGQGAYVFNLQMPSHSRPADPYQLGIVNQEQVDQGLVNAAREKHGQYVVEDNRARPAEPEPVRPPVRNKDLEDGISIDDDFGIDD